MKKVRDLMPFVLCISLRKVGKINLEISLKNKTHSILITYLIGTFVINFQNKGSVGGATNLKRNLSHQN